MRRLLANLSAIGRVSAHWVVQECGWGPEGAAGEAEVRLSLLDLGLDARKLPARSRARLRANVGCLAGEACEPHFPRRIAMRFFTWYVMDAPDFTPAALKGEGAVSDAIGVILGWCETNPELVKAAAPEFHRLSAHLFHKREGRAALWSDVRGATQMRLVDS